MPARCSVNGCSNKPTKGSGISFHKIPSDPELRNEWLVAIGREKWVPLKSSHVCGMHFQTGKPHHEPEHPDYVPNIFNFTNKNLTPSISSHITKVKVEVDESFLPVCEVTDFLSSAKSHINSRDLDYISKHSTENRSRSPSHDREETDENKETFQLREELLSERSLSREDVDRIASPNRSNGMLHTDYCSL